MGTARSRRVEYSEATRQALVDSAVALFTKYGYAGTSLDEIARQARVTKGALYHHFRGKRGLFDAAFESVNANVVRRVAEVVTASDNPWETMRSGLSAFLQVCLEPSYQRIVCQEGPAVMGWRTWSEADEKWTFGIVRNVVQLLVDSGEIEPLPVGTLSRIVYAALSAGATRIASSEDPQQTSLEVGQCLERLIAGLRLGDCPGSSAASSPMA